MRLYLLPISTRRTLLYAQRLHVTTTSVNDRNLLDKATGLAAKKWSEWEKKDKGWQKKVVEYGNHAFRRIPYEEWGLKSVPPLSARRRDEEIKGQEKVQLIFPESTIPIHRAESIVRTLATERQALHKKRLIWCLVGMPLSAPFALVPMYVPFKPALASRRNTNILLVYPTCPSSTSSTAPGRIGAPSPAENTSTGFLTTSSSCPRPPRRWMNYIDKMAHPLKMSQTRSRCS